MEKCICTANQIDTITSRSESLSSSTLVLEIDGVDFTLKKAVVEIFAMTTLCRIIGENIE